MIKVKDIAKAIEDFAPKSLQESYDNTGLQIGDPEMPVSAVMLCLDVTEEILAEARRRQCNMIVSHHPLLFSGLKQITGDTPTQRIVINALRDNIAIYAAHTNLDSALDGVSYEIANTLGIVNPRPLQPSAPDAMTGLGVIGDIKPTPKIEFLRRVKDALNVTHLKYSAQSPQIVVRKVAVCGGSGSSMIREALAAGADALLTGDLRYHDFTSYGYAILLADIGHYESELCTKKLFSRIIRGAIPDCVIYFADSESNPIAYI
ncbi:MAG: Nif3-like dinuclear metal center hexameric protein [Muribaculaceae bacterium]|nr:Nif3-like dinuclear metal center hexameric protein [Muribaculaceae bacterium]MDE5924502.1 Nif3-like dinuclear metal center hexameric protein [Muribaculaceae bacterium]MDE6330781.1 Nif3-like dinuclear metal center hexameric protein [Muribaculaceae bacterium]